MPDPYDELTDLELQNRGIPRITVRPSDVPAPPPNDMPWGVPAEQGGRPSGRLFEPDQTPSPQQTFREDWRPVSRDEAGNMRIFGMRPSFPGLAGEVAQGLGSIASGAASAAGAVGSGLKAAGETIFGGQARLPPWAKTSDPIENLRRQQEAGQPLQPPGPILQGATAAGSHIVGDILQAPRNMVEGAQVQFSPGATPEQVEAAKQQQIKGAADIGMGLMGAGTTFAAARPGISAGLFGGRMSPKANQANFDLAEQMAAKGISSKQIFDATGLRQFPDGKFRFEVSDHNARFKGLPDEYDVEKVTQQVFRENNPEQGLDLFGKKTGIRPPKEGSDRWRTEMLKARQIATQRVEHMPALTWGDLMHHPDALEAFPYLKDMPVYINPNSSHLAAYFPPRYKGEAPFMEVNAKDLDPRGKTFEALLHEPQHAIQQEEGFARGANTSYIEPGGPAEEIYKKTLAEMTQPMGFSEWLRQNPHVSDPIIASGYYDNYVKGFNLSPAQRQMAEKYAKEQTGRRVYIASAGENEADVAARVRAGYNPITRANIDPLAEMRTPPSQQVVEFNQPLADAPQEMGGVLNPVPREMRAQTKAKEPELSFNPLDKKQTDVTWNGKPMRAWTPDEWKAFGDHYGIKNLGPLSETKNFSVKDPSGNPYNFVLPGGLEGKWTYYDLLHMKANPIDPSRIPRELHAEMQKKLGRTMTPDELTPEHVWNGLVFGMTSPNNPLFPNQLSASRLRYRDPKMIDQLADMIPWKAGETVPEDVRTRFNGQIASAFGLQAGPAGGLGTRGSGNYTYIAELAQMFRDHPNWFTKTATESWDHYVERLATQTKGLSMKTGSFGSVWQDPANAAISAIDRHMARRFDESGGLFSTPAERTDWQNKLVPKWNEREAKRVREQTAENAKLAEKGKPTSTVRPVDEAKDFEDLKTKGAFDGFMGEQLLAYVGKHGGGKFRTAKGEINLNLPPHLQRTDWPYEPNEVIRAGEAYRRALSENQRMANEMGLNLFMSQWFEWDRIRRRFEPHENMFPGLSRAPAPSKSQLETVNKAHAETGHKTYTKDEEAQLPPTKPYLGNPSELGYLGVAGTAGAGAMGSLADPRGYQQ